MCSVEDSDDFRKFPCDVIKNCINCVQSHIPRTFYVEVATNRNYYSLAVGDEVDISTHTQCGSAPIGNATETDAKYVVPCHDVGRYLSITRNTGTELHYMALCEVIVMGYVYNGNDSTGKCCNLEMSFHCILYNYVYVCV